MATDDDETPPVTGFEGVNVKDLAKVVADAVDARLVATFGLQQTQVQLARAMRSQMEYHVARAYLDILAAMAEIPARKLGIAVRFTETPIERIDTGRIPLQIDVRVHGDQVVRGLTGTGAPALHTVPLGYTPSLGKVGPDVDEDGNPLTPTVTTPPDFTNTWTPGVRPVVRRTKRLERYLRAGISSRRMFLGETSTDPEVQRRTKANYSIRTRQRLEKILLLFTQEPFISIKIPRLKYRIDEIYAEARGLVNRALLNKFDVDALVQTEDEVIALLVRARELVIFTDYDDPSGLSGSQAEEKALRFVRRRLRKQTEKLEEVKRRLAIREQRLKNLRKKTELVQGPIEMIDFDPGVARTDPNTPPGFLDEDSYD
jgi:hypothetical protein